MSETERRKAAEEIAESLLWSHSADRRRGTANHPEVKIVAIRFAAWAKERETFAASEMLAMIRASVHPDSTGMDVEIGQHLDARAAIGRDSALLEAAGLVCSDCAKGLKPERQELRNFGFIWMHLDSEEIDTNCAAGSIHERRAHGKEPKA